MILLHNISKLYTLEGAVRKQGRKPLAEDLSIIENGALIINKKNKIQWVGSIKNIPKGKYKKINCKGHLVLPGLVDSHTHLVFAGDRSNEFEWKLQGKTYLEIAALGGGINSTVKATREISKKDLLKLSVARLKALKSQGVRTVEIKTGYGLSFESEKKCLEIISELKKTKGMTVLSTFLPGHAIPPEFKGNKDGYVEEFTKNWLPKLKSKADFVDMFVDEGYFDFQDGEKFFKAAQDLKIPVKLHADELKLTGGSELAVKVKALSADHLLKITDKEIELLANSEVTATLLPTTAFFLNTDFAPARKLIDSGARVALASDYNPGTSPTLEPWMVGLLSGLKMKMTLAEILVGYTLNGAFALGLEESKGALIPGYDADYIVVNSDSAASLFNAPSYL